MIVQYFFLLLVGKLPVEVDMVTVHLPSSVANQVSLPPPLPPHRGGSDDDLDKESLFTPSVKTSRLCKPNSRSETKEPSEDKDEELMMTTDRTNKESLASKCPVSNDYEETDLPPPLHISSAYRSGIKV